MCARAGAAAGLLKALASRNRLTILCRLAEGEQRVGALASALGLRDEAVAQHLRQLRRDGHVAVRRDGRTLRYALQGDAAGRVVRRLYDIYCAPAAVPETEPGAATKGECP